MFQPLYINWNDSNNLGIPIIDEQHRGIVSLINSCHYFIKEGQGLDTLIPTMNVLEHLTLLHFKTEEGLFVNSDFPERKEHILAHGKFFRQAQAASREALSSGDAQVVLNLLKRWWIDHINIDDRKYLPYVKGR